MFLYIFKNIFLWSEGRIPYWLVLKTWVMVVNANGEGVGVELELKLVLMSRKSVNDYNFFNILYMQRLHKYQNKEPPYEFLSELSENQLILTIKI